MNGENAQIAAIRGRIVELVELDPSLPFKVDPMNGRKAQESGLRLNA